MKLLDYSVTQIAHPDIYVRGGVFHYDMNFRCAHTQAAVVKGEYPFATYAVTCLGCHGEDLTEDDCDEMILAHIDEMNGMVL
jgi:hypothetical protein